jgi:hypothetical protein
MTLHYFAQFARSGDAARCPELRVLREEIFEAIEDVGAIRFAAAGSCSAICVRREMRSWIDSGDHMSVIYARATDAYAWGDGRSWFVSHDAAHSLTRLCGMPSPRSREESAATAPEICHSLSSRYAAIAWVARNERERPVECAIFSRRFFSAFRTRMMIVDVRGVSIMYIVSQTA